MEFRRYNSIDNYWNMDKTIDRWALPDFDIDKSYSWKVSEKIHGSNICVIEGPNFFTRNGNELPKEYARILNKYDWNTFFRTFRDIGMVYGEIAGPGIQKGVNYGEEKRFYIFDVVDRKGEFVLNFFGFIPGFDFAPYSVQKSVYKNVIEHLQKVLSTDPVSEINSEEGNILEGYVITCTNFPMITANDRFIFKIKHPKFNEKQRSKKKVVEYDCSAIDPYINQNRIDSAVSKYPEYTRSQIGEVIREVLQDIRKDFKSDGNEWDKKYGKYITSKISTDIVKNAEIEMRGKNQ